MKRKRSKQVPAAVDAAFQSHAGLAIQELEALLDKAAKGPLPAAEQARLDRALAALAFEDAEE